MSSTSFGLSLSWLGKRITHSLRRTAFYALLCCPLTAWSSSCGVVLSGGTDNVFVEVWYGSNCDNTGSIVFTRKKDKNGNFDREDMIHRGVPFENECAFSSLGDDTNAILSCRADGRSPLAGAKYLLKQAGTYTLRCGEMGGYPDTPRMQYQCVSGCSAKTPMVLDKEDRCD